MALDVLELHHHAVRMPLAKVAAMGAFYGDVLGLDTDKGRWEIPGIAGYFLDMGNDCQIHLLGSDGPSPYSQGPGRDPVENMWRWRCGTLLRPKPNSSVKRWTTGSWTMWRRPN